MTEFTNILSAESNTSVVEFLQEVPIGQETAYDSIWGGGEVFIQDPSALESIMLSNDKLYVVLAVVLIIWVGVVFLILRTDRKIDKLERTVDERIRDDEDDL